jgi:hypothetical protein
MHRATLQAILLRSAVFLYDRLNLLSMLFTVLWLVRVLFTTPGAYWRSG